MNKDLPSTPFCVLPWIHRFTNIGGEVQVCCSSEEFDNSILGDNGKPILASEGRPDSEIMNTKYMKTLRRKMLRGEWPKICERCKITENTGGISRRNSENDTHQDMIDELIQSTQPDGHIPVNVRSMDFRLGNLCNLYCRMCSPRSSTRWLKVWNQVDQDLILLSPELKETFSSYDWFDEPKLFQEFETQAKNLRHLHFAGGEPLIMPAMEKFLKICVAQNCAKDIDLTYNTNLTVLHDRVTSLWKHFKSVTLLCSIDGFGPLNEFIRQGSRWETLVKNLRFIEENHQKYKIKQALIMCTLQVYNVFNLGELFDFLAENFKFVYQIPQLVDLYFPDYYRTQILPPSLKRDAAQALSQIKAKAKQRIHDGLIPQSQEYLLKSLDGAIAFMNSEDKQHLIDQFLRATRSIDEIRGQSTFLNIPKLKEVDL